MLMIIDKKLWWYRKFDGQIAAKVLIHQKFRVLKV